MAERFMGWGRSILDFGGQLINVRPFAWYDLLTFYRYRRQILRTDIAQALTRGGLISPLALLTRLRPSIEVHTAICSSGKENLPLIGQMQHRIGHRSARITFLMPADALDNSCLPGLLEYMAAQAGVWGAFHLLAEIEEGCCALEEMRRTGFSIYAWQRVWQFRQHIQSAQAVAGEWRAATSLDENAIRNLYQSLVPPLVQSAEPLSARRLRGWVYIQDHEVLAYVEGIYGPQGIYYHPLIHPAIENVSQVIAALLGQESPRPNRPVYIAIRSYQAWLETIVRDLECQVGPRQALMVKHLVVRQVTNTVLARHLAIDSYRAEPTAPLLQNAAAHSELFAEKRS